MDRKLIAGSIILGLSSIGGLAWHLSSAASAQEGPELIVYWEENFNGRSLRITGDLLDMPKGVDEEGREYTWNDAISSIEVVRGTWRVYQNGRFNTALDETSIDVLKINEKPAVNGWCREISASANGPIRYATAASGGWGNDEISSIQLVSDEALPDWACFVPRT